jgi:hypothetical protein
MPKSSGFMFSASAIFFCGSSASGFLFPGAIRIEFPLYAVIAPGTLREGLD